MDIPDFTRAVQRALSGIDVIDATWPSSDEPAAVHVETADGSEFIIRITRAGETQ